MFGKLFKPRAHYVFNYKPRYYDERKERIKKIEEKYHGTDSNSDEGAPRIRLSKNNLKNEWIKNKHSATDRATNLRLAIIIAILVGIAAYLFDLHSLF